MAKHPYRKTRNPLRFLTLLFLTVLIICLALFIYFYNGGSSDLLTPGGKVGPSKKAGKAGFDLNQNPKAFGEAEVTKDDKGNPVVKLNTEFKPLNDAVDKIVRDLQTKALSYPSYTIDCDSNVLFDKIYGVEYLLYDGKVAPENIRERFRVYYSKNMDRIIDASMILRNNWKNILRLRYPDSGITDLPTDNFEMQKDQIIFRGKKDGQPVEVKMPYEKFKKVWKSDTGIPCLYDGEFFRPKLRPVDPNRKMIALTFDDGPLNENHRKIRELFDQYEGYASFFMVGTAIEENPQMVIDTYKKGHQLASHSMTHPQMTLLSEAQQAEQILDTDDLIFKLTGCDVTAFRPPYGMYNATTEAVTNATIALWTVDSLDWQSRDKNKILEAVRPHIADRAVVLFHDLYEPTYEAVKVLVPELVAEGYQLVRFDQLIDQINKDQKAKEAEEAAAQKNTDQTSGQNAPAETAPAQTQ